MDGLQARSQAAFQNAVTPLQGLFVRQHLHHRAQPGVEAAFLNVPFNLDRVFEAQAGEFVAQGCQCHHQFHHGGATGAVLQLRRGVGLQDEDAAGAQAGDGAGVDFTAQGRGQVAEDGDDGVPGFRNDRVIGQVGNHGVEVHAALAGEVACLVEADRGAVDGNHIEALFGEEDGIAAFAFGEAEHPAHGQAVDDAGEEVIRLGAVDVFLDGVALVPHGQPLSR